MRKAAIGLALFVAATVASAASAQTSGWQVSEVSGDVRAVVNGQSRSVTRGMLLASGSTIASGARARAVLVSGRDYMILSPASRVRLPGGSQQISGGSWAQNMTQIVSEAGTALFRIEHRPNPHFRVQTPYLAAVVKGTVFSVTVTSSGASVQVTEGAVQVSTVDGGAAELIRPGMVATVEAGNLMELDIHGEVSRSIRSSGTPLPGVATVSAADAGHYDGPADGVVEVTATVREEPVSLSDATDGLVSGQAGVNLATADLRGDTRPAVEVGGGVGDGGRGNNGGGNADAGIGGGNGNSGSGTNNGDGNDDAGNGGGDGNSGPGNNDGGSNNAADAGDDGNNGHGNDADGNDDSNPGNGGGNHPGQGSGGSDNSGPGNNNGGGNDNSGPGNNNGGGNDAADAGDDGNNGHGNDDDGNDDGNPGNGNGGGKGHGNGGSALCPPAELACIGGSPGR